MRCHVLIFASLLSQAQLIAVKKKVFPVLKSPQEWRLLGPSLPLEENHGKVGGAFYLWVKTEQSYGGAGDHSFVNRNKGRLHNSTNMEGFKGVNYNQLSDIDIWHYIGKATNPQFRSIVPRSKNVPAIPQEHGKKAVAILFSYLQLLEHIVSLNKTSAHYLLVESDQILQKNWEKKFEKAADTSPKDADALIMKWGNPGAHVQNGWSKATGTPPIGAWAVTGASARRILDAVKAHKFDCVDFDCVLGELNTKRKLKVLQAPGHMTLA